MHSNPTYFVTSANGARYVLRKKPAGDLVSQTAHAVEREYAVIDAVGKTGKVPVPKVYALCTDSKVLGTPFYVMEYLEGRIFTDVRMPELKTKEERVQWCGFRLVPCSGNWLLIFEFGLQLEEHRQGSR